jgi:hypothetical protein
LPFGSGDGITLCPSGPTIGDSSTTIYARRFSAATPLSI